MKFHFLRSAKKKETTKYCTVYKVGELFIVVNMFRVNRGPLESGEAEFIDKNNFNEIGNAVISSLNSYNDFGIEITDRKDFFLDNLKRYGYSSYRDFHKKIDSCIHIEMKDQQIWIIPTKKDQYGFEHKTEQVQICAIDDKEVTKLINNLHPEISRETLQ